MPERSCRRRAHGSSRSSPTAWSITCWISGSLVGATTRAGLARARAQAPVVALKKKGGRARVVPRARDKARPTSLSGLWLLQAQRDESHLAVGICDQEQRRAPSVRLELID